MWTLIGTCKHPSQPALLLAKIAYIDNYYLFSEDTEWLQTIWTNYTKAVAFVEGKVNPSLGLMNVTGLRDWARQGGGGINAEGNAILYKVSTSPSILTSASNFLFSFPFFFLFFSYLLRSPSSITKHLI